MQISLTREEKLQKLKSKRTFEPSKTIKRMHNQQIKKKTRWPPK